jgi:hypothetical protein
VTCEAEIPKVLISLCITYKLVNYQEFTEGSTDFLDATKNKYRKRFMISLPEYLDGLPDLTEIFSPPTYSSEQNKQVEKRMMFD